MFNCLSTSQLLKQKKLNNNNSRENRQDNKIRNLEREINILNILEYPIIAKLIETIETTNEIYLILEYGGANSLYNYLLSKP